MNFSDVRLAIDWLISGCPSVSTPQQVLAELCNRLVCCGIPLSCAEVFVRTLHPNVMGLRFTWRVGSDVEISEISFDSLKSPEFKNSPVAQVCESGVAFRLRLGDADSFSSLLIHAFRNEQLTDFLATPLVFSNGETHVATWVTQQTGGFADDEITSLESIIGPLARVAEVYALRRTAANLLDTYVGHDTGERILLAFSVRTELVFPELLEKTALVDFLKQREINKTLRRCLLCLRLPFSHFVQNKLYALESRVRNFLESL